MLPLPYTQNKALGTLSGFLNSIESKLQPVLRRRKVKGKERTYYVPPKALSDGAQATARLLVTMGLRAVEQVRGCSFLQEAATDAAPTAPPISTNNEELARIRKVSSRTIRQHLREIETVGILVARKFRGTHANFELWISTKFLWKTDAQAVSPQTAENRTKAAQAAPGPPTQTNFPLIEVLEKQVKKESASGEVEKLATTPAPASLTGNTGSQHPPQPAPTAPARPRPAKRARKDRGEGGAAKVPTDAGKALFLERQRDMAREFFFASWKTLYAGESFDERAQTMWKKAVWNGVYRGFAASLSETEWEQFHQQALYRLRMVAQYLLKYPQRYVGKPYAEFVAGTGYFDAENQHGFAGTEAWYVRKQARNAQLSLTRDLKSARQRLNGHRLGLGTRRDLARTRLQLYHLLENSLRRKHGAEGLALFRQAVVAPRT